MALLKLAKASIIFASESTNRSIRANIRVCPCGLWIVEVVSPMSASAIEARVFSGEPFGDVAACAAMVPVAVKDCVSGVPITDVVIAVLQKVS